MKGVIPGQSTTRQLWLDSERYDGHQGSRVVANASDVERHQYDTYHSENLDPYRCIIRKDVDIPLEPDPGDTTIQDMTLQEPRGMCDTCPVDPGFWFPGYWNITMNQL
jgi:hypothetical protein